MTESPDTRTAPCPVEVRGLTMAYGTRVIQRDLTFDIRRGETFVIMGGSGCGKSTLLRHLIGLAEPAAGTIRRDGIDFFRATGAERDAVRRRTGIMYQSGGLWSALTLEENIAVPLREFTPLSSRDIRDLVSLKLALVGLAGCEKLLPAQLSGGMLKRASLARAMALDPDILFCDEPSAGLDPLSARRLDDLIIELRNSLRTTVVVVTHDLPSIFAIATDSIFLDAETRTLRARGNPAELLRTSRDDTLIRFLTRGEHGTRTDSHHA